MKKIAAILLLLIGINYCYAQHPTPIKLTAEVDSFALALSPGLSLDGGNGTSLSKSLSNSLNISFILNALEKKKAGNYGATKVFHQFIVDLNPIIVGWDPFTWNKLAKESADTFSVGKMTFAEDALLHVGWHRVALSKILQGGKNQFNQLMYFGEFYYRPYKIDVDSTDCRFSVLNFSGGVQYGFLKKDIPSLKYFLIAISGQLNYMNVNEADAYLGSLKKCLGDSYHGKNYLGPGLKLTVQFMHFNIYAESRWYFAIDKHQNGRQFTHDPLIQVGAFADIPWVFKNKPKKTDPDQQNKHFE